MNYQDFVDGFQMAAAVLSVEKKPDDQWGVIRIEKANTLYRQIMGPGYQDGMPYDTLIPKEPIFEDFCYRCAVKKQHLHAYVDTKSMGVWTDGTYIPLSHEEGDKAYLTFFFEFTKAPEAEKMSDISIATAPRVIQTCIKLRGADKFYEAMRQVISDIQEVTDAFCACIILVDDERKKFGAVCEKFRDDTNSIEDFREFLTYDVIATWAPMLKNGSAIIKDDYQMQEFEKVNPVWIKSLRDADVHSVILVPLERGKNRMGYLFLTNFDTSRLVEIKEYVELTSFFLSAEVASNDLMERLEYMSNMDFLTGIQNRNAMNARVDYSIRGEKPVKIPYGIIFADLNGLKICNDKYGHEAGDKLLKKAAGVLQEIFTNEELYRAGGDEFVIIAPNCPEEEFQKKEKLLRERTSYGNEVCFAVGSYWTSHNDDLRYSMRVADEAMYHDKTDFYSEHKDVKRRKL